MELEEILTEAQEIFAEAITAEQMRKPAEAHYQMEQLRDLLNREVPRFVPETVRTAEEIEREERAEKLTSKMTAKIDPDKAERSEKDSGSGVI